MWLPREQVFNYSTNKYYKPNGKFNTRSATDSLAMPNCTMYSFLRMQEAAECEERQNYWIRACGGYGNAKTWYATTTLPKGSEPREGAIAVWDGTCGHVNFVERLTDKTHGVLTESNYNSNKSLRNWYFWNKRNNVELVVGKSKLPGTGKLLGFIYVPIDDKRVSRDTSVDQVEITQTLVNVRIGPSTKKAIVCQGLYCPVGIFNVEEWAEADGYTWAKLDDDCWVSCGSWAKIYKKQETKTQLKAKLKELNAKKTELEEELKEVKAEIKEIEAKLK